MSSMAAQSEKHDVLSDETFMSAADLRNYMEQIELAKASQQFSAIESAEAARLQLVKTLSEPIDLTAEKVAELKHTLIQKIKSAAERGELEILVMRFPNALCTDHGRAINNTNENWPDSLTGRPRQAYEFWRDHLRASNFKFRAMIIEWPNGMPGDVGFFLSWA